MRQPGRIAACLAVLVSVASITACFPPNPVPELKQELANAVDTVRGSFYRTMVTTNVAEWEQAMLDPRGRVQGVRWSGVEADAAGLNASGATILYDIDQDENRLRFRSMISASVETGSGMLYKNHVAYVCLRLTAHYEPGKVTVEAKDATCALPLQAQVRGGVKYTMDDLAEMGH